MENWQPCSRILTHILNYMGYCPWIINARKKFFNEVEHRLKDGLISGSKGEGLTNILQSDTDILTFSDHICGIIEKDGTVSDVETKNKARYMFKVERDWSPPGYCMLLLASRPTLLQAEAIGSCLLVVDREVVCLQSKKIRDGLTDEMKSSDLSTKQPTGPSQPTTLFGWIENDNVITFSCPCSAELDAWYKRPRHHDWPSNSLQQDVVSTLANVVPVGSKDGIFDQMEWRFCFNRAELKLMHSLNPTQTHLYVVLKMILKDHLKPTNKEITSYVMKNIVLWMCETNPSFLFTPNTLLSWIYEGLQTLKGHVESGNLPYYMIPERNLLQGKFLDDATKIPFLDKLSMLLESGACLVHVCKTIKLGLELYNEGLLENYGWKRNLVETHILALFSNPLPDCVEVKHELLHLAGIDYPLQKVLLPDIETLVVQGYTLEEIDKVMYYRAGEFLNEEKAEDFAQYIVSY